MLFEFNYISNQQDAAKFVLSILLSFLYMFRATVSPIFRSTLTVVTAFLEKKVPTLLSAAGRQQTAELVHCTSDTMSHNQQAFEFICFVTSQVINYIK